MTFRYSAFACAAAVIAFLTAASAQAPPQQTPDRPNPSQQVTAAADQQTMVTGCIQRESDYRRARDAGRGGVAGTGVGAGNEFILANASMSTGASSGAAGTAGRTAGAATGTGGTTAASVAYELTGANEGQAAQHVGKRVEISGKLKAAEVDSAGRSTGGPTAGKPPEGVDVAGKDLRLRELEVASIREVPGTCPAN